MELREQLVHEVAQVGGSRPKKSLESIGSPGRKWQDWDLPHLKGQNLGFLRIFKLFLVGFSSDFWLCSETGVGFSLAFPITIRRMKKISVKSYLIQSIFLSFRKIW